MQRALSERFSRIRDYTESLCDPLEIEDYVVQPRAEVSPPKWHLGHTSWFFEKFVLEPYDPNFKPYHPQYFYLFNSYYQSMGKHIERTNRGVLSRPTVKEVMAYRRSITSQVLALLEKPLESKALELIDIGIHHEQQHQELFLMDVLAIFWANPLRPAYRSDSRKEERRGSNASEETSHVNSWVEIEGGVREIGSSGDAFSYDNERPRHKVWVDSFAIQNRAVTNGEYLEFINDGGYSRFEFWLENAWEIVRKRDWKAPGYWLQQDDQWMQMSLYGLNPLRLDDPVVNISFFEAMAYASWKKLRLPREEEWEVASKTLDVSKRLLAGNFLESVEWAPESVVDVSEDVRFPDLFGNTWEWTMSPYVPYPGYLKPQGSLGEYNSKFMDNQRVTRGGCFATPREHYRPSYRNFYYPYERWHFSGFRLLKELS